MTNTYRLRPPTFVMVILIGALAGILLWPFVAFGADGAPEVPANLLPRLFIAVVTGHWRVALGLALATIIATAATHKAGFSRFIPWFTTDAGATVWTFIVSTIGAWATSLAIGLPVSIATLETGVGVGALAVGGYSGARKLLGPSGIGRWIPWLDRVADAFGPKNEGGDR